MPNKAHQTQRDKYGGEEGYNAEMKRRRSLVKKPTGFAVIDKKKHLEASRKGGVNRWKNADKDIPRRQSI